MEIAGIVILALVVVTVIWTVAMYNRLVQLKNRYKNAFAQIEVTPGGTSYSMVNCSPSGSTRKYVSWME